MRDVTLQATANDLVGDETYELWLKHESDAWALEETGDVSVDGSSHQTFVLYGLTFGDQYVAQFRLKRAGRYRVGYLTANPDTWPEQSRCEFIPGALEGVGAPTITDAVWARTSSSATAITLTINADLDALDKNMRVYRDGIAVGTIAAPHTNPVTYVDNDPSVGSNHTYTVRHYAGALEGLSSTPLDCFAGPLPPASFTRTSPDSQYGKYNVSWDADSDPVRLQDDFLCPLVFHAVISPPGTTTASDFEVQVEGTLSPPGGTMTATFNARARREVTAFTITDVSDWVETAIIMLIDDTNTDYNSCP